jgi:hypothetical protein
MEVSNELLTVHEWEAKPLEPILEPLIRKELEELK